MNTNEFKADFQLLDSNVASFVFENKFICIEDDMDLDRQIDVEYSTDRLEDYKEYRMGTVTLNVKFSIKEKEDEAKDQRRSCIGDLEISGLFCAQSESIEDDLFNKMLEVNGCATMISLVRAFIISVSAQSIGTGKIILPLLNINQMHEKLEKK